MSTPPITVEDMIAALQAALGLDLLTTREDAALALALTEYQQRAALAPGQSVTYVRTPIPQEQPHPFHDPEAS